MKFIKVKYIIFIIITVAWVSTAKGQETDSLNHYLEIAAINNPGVNAAFLAYKASLERVPQSGAWPDPELDISFFLQPMEIIGGRQIADLTLMQMFPWFGTKKAAEAEAAHMAKMAYEQFRETRDKLFMEVYSQWYTLASLQQQLDNNRNNLKLLEQLEELSRQKMSTASSMLSDMTEFSGLSNVLRVQLEEAEIENNIESLLSEITAEKAKFNALLNRPVGIEVIVPETITKVIFSFDEIAAINDIKNQNPLLGMIMEEEQAYRAKSAMDTKMSYPMLGIGLQYMFVGKSSPQALNSSIHNGMNGMDMIMPMVSISLPIFRNKYKAQQLENRYLWESASEKYNNTLNILQSDLFKLKHQLDDAERQIALAQKQRELASTTYQLILQEFVASKSNLSSVIEIQRQLLDYHAREAEAIADYNTKVAEINSLFSFTD